MLRPYERWRKSEVAFMSTAIDAFDRFLAHGTGPVSRLAQRGLGWVNRSQEIKRMFVSRALGWQASCRARPGKKSGRSWGLWLGTRITRRRFAVRLARPGRPAGRYPSPTPKTTRPRSCGASSFLAGGLGFEPR